MDPDEAAEFFKANFLEIAEKCIPRAPKKFRKSTHPWLTNAGVEAVREKLAAQGQEDERDKAEQCSRILMGEFNEHVSRSRGKLADDKGSPKKWWVQARQLMQSRQKTSSIPALKNGNLWTTDAKGKADCVVDTFAKKNKMCELDVNEYTDIGKLHEVRRRPGS